MIIALTYVGISFTLLLFLTVLYVVEDIRDKRIFLVSARASLDVLLTAIAHKLRAWRYVCTTGFMRILFHYGAHSILKRVLLLLHRLEQNVETLVRKNRTVVRNLRTKSRNHLDEIADHKEETALTSKEKEKLLLH